ncbi:MAG: type II toxin-antitoxin system prevent-host-death family antitoxin [Magnetococcales bacterium]|nr:type II toxin-antitoxin system prevent-host-death family antitoxin [Magnetococcales bacterium]
MTLVDIREADGHLAEWVKKVVLGEEVVLSEGSKPLVKLVPIIPRKRVRQPGSAKEDILFISPNFDDPLEAFRDYMP